jgi:hypothetical protein
MNIQAKIALALLHSMLDYLKKHPEALDSIVQKITDLIPGPVDDFVIAAIRKLLGI